MIGEKPAAARPVWGDGGGWSVAVCDKPPTTMKRRGRMIMRKLFTTLAVVAAAALLLPAAALAQANKLVVGMPTT